MSKRSQKSCTKRGLDLASAGICSLKLSSSAGRRCDIISIKSQRKIGGNGQERDNQICKKRGRSEEEAVFNNKRANLSVAVFLLLF